MSTTQPWSTLTISLCLALTACDGKTETKKASGDANADAKTDEAGEPPTGEAEAGDPSETTTAAAGETGETDEASTDASPKTEVLRADPKHSKVEFHVARATTGHVAEFNRYDARLELAEGAPQRLEIAVKLGSVAADRQGLTQHLKSSDFFDVDKFPTASFATDAIEPVADEPNRYQLRGKMRLHGISKDLKFPATIEISDERALGTASLEISAKAFGIDYEGMEAELAEDEVSLEIELAFPRVEQP